jgi:hypothetical protein
MTVGATLSIPGGILGDWIFNGYLLPWRAALGVAILCIGVGLYYGSDLMVAIQKKRLKKLEAVQKKNADLLDDFPR